MLELGGKSVNIVFYDCDLECVVMIVLVGVFDNVG